MKDEGSVAEDESTGRGLGWGEAPLLDRPDGARLIFANKGDAPQQRHVPLYLFR
jgi:hypothetical protein